MLSPSTDLRLGEGWDEGKINHDGKRFLIHAEQVLGNEAING
jgi:hypothetical protein